MTYKIDIPIIYCRLIVTIACGNTLEIKELLATTGIDIEMLSAGNTSMSVSQYKKLIRNIILKTGKDSALLEIGERIPITAHGPMGKAFIYSPNWRTGLAMMEQFISLRGDFIKMKLIEHDDYVQATINLDEQLGEEIDQAYDFILGIFSSFRKNCLTQLMPIKVELARPTPTYHSQLSDSLQCDILYGKAANSMFFRKSEIDAPSPIYDPTEFGNAIDECQRLFRNAKRQGDIKEEIWTVFQRNRGIICTIDKVADHLHVSKRTLQRQLAEAGESFQMILEDWLKQLAVECLQKEKLSTEVTAAVLGYNDGATFRRAFKRWFGVTPSNYLNRGVQND